MAQGCPRGEPPRACALWRCCASGRVARPLSPQNSRCERLWIGSYVSCQGTRILEQTMQVARHIRCIVLRSSTEVARSCRRSAVARFMQYGDCIRLLLPRLERTPLPAARQWRYEASAPRSTSCLTRHTSASPDKCCQLRAVAQRLSTNGLIRSPLRRPATPCHSWRKRARCGTLSPRVLLGAQ